MIAVSDTEKIKLLPYAVELLKLIERAYMVKQYGVRFLYKLLLEHDDGFFKLATRLIFEKFQDEHHDIEIRNIETLMNFINNGEYGLLSLKRKMQLEVLRALKAGVPFKTVNIIIFSFFGFGLKTEYIQAIKNADERLHKKIFDGNEFLDYKIDDYLTF